MDYLDHLALKVLLDHLDHLALKALVDYLDHLDHRDLQVCS